MLNMQKYTLYAKKHQNMQYSIRICKIIPHKDSCYVAVYGNYYMLRWQYMHRSGSTHTVPYRECAYFTFFVSKCGICRNQRGRAYVQRVCPYFAFFAYIANLRREEPYMKSHWQRRNVRSRKQISSIINLFHNQSIDSTLNPQSFRICFPIKN